MSEWIATPRYQRSMRVRIVLECGHRYGGYFTLERAQERLPVRCHICRRVIPVASIQPLRQGRWI